MAAPSDDLGTGYSWLAYLRRSPADQLEIDCACVAGLAVYAVAIVPSVMYLGQSGGLRVVLEGLESWAAWPPLQPALFAPAHLRPRACRPE